MAATGGEVASSSALERDARLASKDGHVSPGEIAIGVVIGRASESFDFFVYGIASVLVFPELLFPFADRLTATLYSFAIFGLAFMARPIGSVVFMEIDRRHGGVRVNRRELAEAGTRAATTGPAGEDHFEVALVRGIEHRGEVGRAQLQVDARLGKHGLEHLRGLARYRVVAEGQFHIEVIVSRGFQHGLHQLRGRLSVGLQWMALRL